MLIIYWVGMPNRSVAVSDVADRVVLDVAEAMRRVGLPSSYSRALNILILIAAAEVYSSVWDDTKRVVKDFIRRNDLVMPDLRMEFQVLLEECLNMSE